MPIKTFKWPGIQIPIDLNQLAIAHLFNDLSIWDEVVSPDLAYNICDAGLMLADVLKDGGTDDGIRADFSDPR